VTEFVDDPVFFLPKFLTAARKTITRKIYTFMPMNSKDGDTPLFLLSVNHYDCF
jgi:hypothetical protein